MTTVIVLKAAGYKSIVGYNQYSESFIVCNSPHADLSLIVVNRTLSKEESVIQEVIAMSLKEIEEMQKENAKWLSSPVPLDYTEIALLFPNVLPKNTPILQMEHNGNYFFEAVLTEPESNFLSKVTISTEIIQLERDNTFEYMRLNPKLLLDKSDTDTELKLIIESDSHVSPNAEEYYDMFKSPLTRYPCGVAIQCWSMKEKMKVNVYIRDDIGYNLITSYGDSYTGDVISLVLHLFHYDLLWIKTSYLNITNNKINSAISLQSVNIDTVPTNAVLLEQGISQLIYIYISMHFRYTYIYMEI